MIHVPIDFEDMRAGRMLSERAGATKWRFSRRNGAARAGRKGRYGFWRKNNAKHISSRESAYWKPTFEPLGRRYSPALNFPRRRGIGASIFRKFFQGTDTVASRWFGKTGRMKKIVNYRKFIIAGMRRRIGEPSAERTMCQHVRGGGFVDTGRLQEEKKRKKALRD